eukprot:CAMPEP_0181362436 /NCGR_PEP_ID=MMETSP1106-20121128/8011_1 /TAXON_ID=81844 /ORGANISM="Mantoniella antarctica, Strain SL-175" /LENGTH=45 /DNA_ID= /DNA_START= /DNA_END= /DNA_ORIENTATION=
MATPLAVLMLRDWVDNGWTRSNTACVTISAACVCGVDVAAGSGRA